MGSMSRWLDVEAGADDININTLPTNVTFSDLQNDNEVKLIIGDFGRGDDGPRLKIFKGAMQISDLTLPDLPLGVVSFYAVDSNPRPQPVIAVAFSSSVHFYRNLKLFYKYYLPSVELNAGELDIWKQLTNPSNHNEVIILKLTESLHNMPHKVLSIQSRDFLTLTFDEQLEYLENTRELPKRRSGEIVCISSIKLSSVDKHAVSCLVLGTEDGEVIVLDSQTFTQTNVVNISPVKKTPFQIVTTGVYNVDYRITVATREKSVCLLKRDWKAGRILFNTDDHIIAIEVFTTDNSVLVICADKTFSCYNRKGRKQWSLILEHRPICLTLVPISHLGMTLSAVALVSGHVTLYDGKYPRDNIFIRGGHLLLKILKRTADFNSNSTGIESSEANISQRPWLIPKKSKLFLEQAMRERENPKAMHEAFQQELNRLRLLTAQTLLEAYRKSDNFVGAGNMEPIRLSAEVEGLGPVFVVTLIVHNTSSERAVSGLSVLFQVISTGYRVHTPYIKVPLIAPGNQLKFPIKVEEVFSENVNPDVFFRNVTGQAGDGSVIKVLLLKEGKVSPVLAATVTMPPTDPMMIPYDKLETSNFGQNISQK
ncbi:unnamed protein product [Danaus chrysippus]|uniref:(African queen) hypothetical protein n=1 Tax=Danaus chrysippus TaxID=151541 RepID=A0A8J2R902_9NEOP|nr:unnamed protein product [Danaus chrysippus]